MLKIRQLQKEKQKNQEGSDHVVNKASPAEIRIGKDLEELVLPSTIKVEHSPKDIKNLKITIKPDEGYYSGGVFKFECSINENYPMEAPKMKCLNKIYHPNIDIEGNVCLNILREDWTPVISLQTVFFGLQFLFLEPNETDPLNKEAAVELNKDRKKFARNVMISMRGGYVNGEYYDNVYS